MHDSNNPALQWKSQKLIFQRFQIILFLSGRYKMHQNLTGSNTSSQHQMPQITGVLQFPVIRSSFFSEKFSYTSQDIRHILMHQLTVVSIQDIIRTSFLMQAKGQWSVFDLISKRKLHLIAVSEFDRASVNTLPFKSCISILIYLTTLDQCLFQKLSYLCLFHMKLVFIGHCLIHAATTCWKIAAYRFSCLQW